jgi:hypothetical protein
MSDAFNPIDAYSGGLMGCRPDKRADEELVDSIIRRGGDPDGGSVAHSWEFSDAGKGKLILLFPAVQSVFPGCWPGPTQLTGDCVARAAANCLLTSLGMEIASGKPDEVTGRLEGAPELPEAGVKDSVVAAESLWAWRGYDRDGWVCSYAAQVATTKGFLVRKPYPELGIDLTEYTERTIRLGGSTSPGQKWLDQSSQHIARTATVLSGREQVRDFLFQGYGVFNCSAMGFERTRNEDGFSRQTGVWHHAQSFLGYDDRPETHKKYGQALVLWNNSWAAWNSGPRRVMGTSIDIPPGSFWSLASTIDKAQCIALSSVAGWPRRQHTTFGAVGNV